MPKSTLPTVAPHPFNQSSADLTLRTPDCVNFHVHSHILSQASPVFADMLSLPQPSSLSQDANAARPIVDVTEDSKTLGRLLCLCYPIEKEKLDELKDIVPVLQAAMKYDMKWPISLLTTDLLAIVPRSPLKVWAVACRCGLEALAQEAASRILRKAKGQSDSQPQRTSPEPPLALLKTMVEEHGKHILHGISAADYFRLREYLRAGDETATTKLLSPTILPPKAPAYQPPPLNPTIPHFPPPDITLRCSEGTEYRVHALFLILHSPTLGERVGATNDVSSSPETQTTTTGNDIHLPPLEVDIDPPTLSTLLAVLYGGNDQLPSDLHSLGSALVAARKFGMAQVTKAAEGRWDSLAASSPLEAYFVAIEHGLADYARFAARKVLEGPVAGAYVRAMESGTALAYHHLLEYYRACARTIDARMKAAVVPWSQDLNNIEYGYRNSNYCPGTLQNPTYIANTYLTGLATTMDTDVPGTGCSFEFTLPALLRASSSTWPNCTATICQGYTEVLMNISASLPQVVADAIAEVQLEMIE
ncbi:hypothetical protein LXA43DRAFT_1061100 [Ganoderma leucocontextum]|nr:hypothetical protein LXA43DRAFT_1061100 [Ganoderma leucocontextum]